MNVSTLGYLDAGLLLDIPSLAHTPGLSERFKMAFENFNGSALVEESCSKDFDQENQWKCLFPEYRYKYIKTPFVLIADQYDDYFL